MSYGRKTRCEAGLALRRSVIILIVCTILYYICRNSTTTVTVGYNTIVNAIAICSEQQPECLTYDMQLMRIHRFWLGVFRTS